MQRLFLCALLVCAYANEFDDDVQQVQQFAKSVKGGYDGQFQYNPGANIASFFGNRTELTGYNMRQNLTAIQHEAELQVGVCYIEVPTATLVRDSSKIPAGNGSQPHLSRIRSCCKGYIRNIHNFRKCDPVCTRDCVNALCTAPDVCTCFPDHVKNLAAFCVPTCPIGCQNGQCAGGECLCKNGYKLDSQSGKFCVPTCQENCGGIGNCTAPNTCDCKPGYKSSPQGSCKPVCDQCTNGECVAPGDCRCHQGFTRNPQGICAPKCGPGYESTPQGCKPVCLSCTNGECVGPNECRCDLGYTGDYKAGTCVPECSPPCGPSSQCIAPDTCTPTPARGDTPYQPPYQLNNQNPLVPHNQYSNQPQPQGVPQCSQPCLNGVCIGGNRCACNPGYVMDQSDPSGTRCVPNCPGGCPNGVCSAPNFCICNMGYVKDHSVKGRPTCVKRAKRSIDLNKPLNVADLLIYEIPDTDM